MEPNQLNIFPEVKPTPAHRAEALVMSQEAVLEWKSQIFDYQRKVRESQPPQQTTLFDIAPKHYVNQFWILDFGFWICSAHYECWACPCVRVACRQTGFWILDLFRPQGTGHEPNNSLFFNLKSKIGSQV